MREVAIIGAGIHKFGRFPEKSYIQMGLEAVRMALDDAGIAWRDVQIAYCSRMYLPALTGLKTLTQLGRTGISIVDVEAACAGGVASLKQAYLAITSGAYDIALAFGVEKMPRGFMEPSMMYPQWQILMGMDQTPMYWGLKANEYKYTYGLTEEHIAKVAYKNHRNSVNNPYAMYQKEYSLEEILNSPLVCDPIRLYEICAPDEGAAAVIIAPYNMAARFTSKPIKIAACIHKIANYPYFSVPMATTSTKITSTTVTKLAADEAYKAAGIGPKDIDIIEMQDTCALNEFEFYTELGICEPGEQIRFIEEGVTEVTGKIPVNVSGGLICKGEPVGASHLGQIFELVTQLKDRAGKRQIANCKTALGQVVGAGGHCGITILKR